MKNFSDFSMCCIAGKKCQYYSNMVAYDSSFSNKNLFKRFDKITDLKFNLLLEQNYEH